MTTKQSKLTGIQSWIVKNPRIASSEFEEINDLLRKLPSKQLALILKLMSAQYSHGAQESRQWHSEYRESQRRYLRERLENRDRSQFKVINGGAS